MKRRWSMALVVIAAGLPGGAAHAAGWRAQELVVPEGNVNAYDMAIAPGGESVHVWQRDDTVLEALIRPQGGGGTRVTLENPSDTDPEPRVAMGPDGAAAVVWENGDHPEVARRPAGGTFGTPEFLGPTAGPADVAILPDGSTWVARPLGALILVQRASAGGSFAAQPDIDPPGALEPTDVRLWPGPNGELVLTYLTTDNDTSGGMIPLTTTTVELHARFKASADGGFGSDDDLLHTASEMGFGGSEIVEINVGGVAYGNGFLSLVADALTESPPSTTSPRAMEVVAASRSLASGPADWDVESLDTGTFDPTGTGGTTVGAPAAARDGAGRIVAAWSHGEHPAGGDGPSEVRVARRDGPGGDFSPQPALATRAAGDRELFGPELVSLPGGDIGSVFADQESPVLLIGSVLLRADGSRSTLATGIGASEGNFPPQEDPSDPSLPFVASPDGHALLAYSPSGSHVALRALDVLRPSFVSVAVPERVTEDRPVGVGASAVDELGTPSIRWDLGDGRTATGATPTVTWPTPGVYTVTVIADDGAGNETHETRVIAVDAAPPVLGPPGARPIDRFAPVISQARLSRSRFAVGPQPTALTAQRRRRAARGTTITYRVNEGAFVALAVQRVTRGYRVGRRCAARRPRRVRGRRVRRCTRLVTRGTIRRNAAPLVVNRIAFSGRLGRRALPAGSYRFAIVARDAAGNVSRPRVLAFRIVRR
jgi:PKD domain